MPSYDLTIYKRTNVGKKLASKLRLASETKFQTIYAENIEELRKKVIPKLSKDDACRVWNGSRYVGRLQWNTEMELPVWYSAKSRGEFTILNRKTGKIDRGY